MIANTIAGRKLFVDFVGSEPLSFFQDHDKNPPATPPTPVKGPEEQDKASKTQAERESEDKLWDTFKVASIREVGSVFQVADHFL